VDLPGIGLVSPRKVRNDSRNHDRGTGYSQAPSVESTTAIGYRDRSGGIGTVRLAIPGAVAPGAIAPGAVAPGAVAPGAVSPRALAHDAPDALAEDGHDAEHKSEV